MSTEGRMSGEASKFVIMKDCFRAILDAVDIFVREICVKFIALWIELVNYQQSKEFDLQRIVALLAILYIISFIDLDFIPFIGKIDDLFVLYYAYDYCCNKKQTDLARAIYKQYRTWWKPLALLWILY